MRYANNILFADFENSNEPTTVIVDSADTLLSDIVSTPGTYKFLSKLYDVIKPHTSNFFHSISSTNSDVDAQDPV